MFDFSGQVALVTGASRGIGRRVAEDLSIHGASVALVSRKGVEIEGVAAAVAATGQPTLGVAMDISSSPPVQEGVRRVLEEFGRIDILVNNAGIVRDKLLLRMKEEDWRQVLNTNLDGVFRVTRAVLRSMVRRRFGRIVNLTSVVGQTGNPGQINYVSSKAGIIGFTKALAREVATRNITVNAIAPGFIDTDMTRSLPARARSELEATIPLKRPGTVGEVAYGVRFLASKEAGYVTGHVLNVNGGMYM
jgi:3-oxoacyl-[acyl-carrier protein] reductase